jgi:hypothetical protein
MTNFILKYAPLWLFRMIIRRAWGRILGWDNNSRPYITYKTLEDDGRFKPKF